MSYLVVCSVAFLASGLTFFSGFGLGTLLLPAFALFFAVEVAVTLTAVVHFFNGVFKLLLVWRHINVRVVSSFGFFAVVGALAGAWALLLLAKGPPLIAYTAFGRDFQIVSIKLVIGAMLLLFAFMEFSPAFRRIAFPPRYLFLGGLAGMQGALRSAFLVKAGLSKESYVATGAANRVFN